MRSPSGTPWHSASSCVTQRAPPAPPRAPSVTQNTLPSAGTSSQAAPSSSGEVTVTEEGDTPSTEKEMAALATPAPRSASSRPSPPHRPARVRTWRAAWRSAASAAGEASAGTPPVSSAPPQAATGSPASADARREGRVRVRASKKGAGEEAEESAGRSRVRRRARMMRGMGRRSAPSRRQKCALPNWGSKLFL